jgi:predicted N-acetyltransferase YhbS
VVKVPKDVMVRPALPEDSAEIGALHVRAFGPGRFARTAYRVREDTAEFSPFCRVCRIDEQLVAAVRFTPILIGGRGRALLLGPLAASILPSPTRATDAGSSAKHSRRHAARA